MRNLQILAHNYVNYCFNLTALCIFMVINTSLFNSALEFPSMAFKLWSKFFKASLTNRLENTPVLKKSNHKVRLGKHMGMFTCIVLTIGSIIGTGIFISPKGILMNAGSSGMSLVVWILCGLISFLGSSVFIELGACLPQSGGIFIYLKTAFGELLAFLYLWMAFLIKAPTTLTILNLTFSNYMLAPLFKDCSPPTGIINIVAALPICFLTFVNCYKVQWATRAQGVFVLTKVLALAIIITAGLVHLIKGNTQNFHSMFQDTNANPGFIALAFYSGLYSYSGWNILNTMTEELKNPFENLPKAAFISLVSVTLIYTLTNVAYFMVLTPNEIMSSNAVAVTFGNRVFGILSWIMQIFVALSTFGNVNAILISKSRLLFVGAREGHLPIILSMVNVDHLTPVPSLLFLCTVSLCYLSTNKIYVLMNFAVFADSIFNALTAAALLWLRYKQPDLGRPIKVNIILPIAYFCVCVFLTAMPMYVRPLETGKGAAIILLGIPVYYGTVFWVNKPKIYLHAIKKLTYVVQILSVSMPEETFECEKKAKTETNGYINYSGLNKTNE